MLKTAATPPGEDRSHVLGVQEVRWEKDGTELGKDCAFFPTKVKFRLEEAIKAQRGCRFIAIFFL
jgi:hypothetical protein